MFNEVLGAGAVKVIEPDNLLNLKITIEVPMPNAILASELNTIYAGDLKAFIDDMVGAEGKEGFYTGCTALKFAKITDVEISQ